MRWPQVRWCSVDCALGDCGDGLNPLLSHNILQYFCCSVFAQIVVLCTLSLWLCISFVAQFEFGLVDWTGGICYYLTHRPLPTRGYHWSSSHHYLTNTALHETTFLWNAMQCCGFKKSDHQHTLSPISTSWTGERAYSLCWSYLGGCCAHSTDQQDHLQRSNRAKMM